MPSVGRCLDQSDILIGLSCERDREVGPGMAAPRAGAPGRWVE
jgi:hypothetical protein